MRLSSVLTRTMTAVAAVALAAPFVLSGGGASAAPPPTLTLTPGTALVDFQRVELTGTGFEPGLYEWFECRGGADDDNDCDGYNADFISVAADGTLEEVIYVDARIYLPDGTEVDCRTDPAGCEIGVGFMVEAGQWPEVHLDFDVDAPLLPPVTGVVSPATGLVDDQVVVVEGAHLSFREEAFAYLCASGDGPVGARCDMDRMARAVPDQNGDVAIDLQVRASFDPPLGEPVDCRAAGAACFVAIGWSFDPPADRQAAMPVSFAARPPVTTPTSAPTTQPLTPPAATPVRSQPSFTG